MKNISAKILFMLSTSFQLVSQVQTSYTNINYNNSNASLSDGGIYFHNATGSSGYEIPKGNSTNAIYSSSFWYGGIDANSQLHLSAQLFTPNVDIFPGPRSGGNYYNTTEYISKYSPALWKISKYEIDQHIANYMNSSYVVPSSIANWPGNGDVSIGVSAQLAPFVDLDNDGLYEPEFGDYPKIKGCEAVYIILNDAAHIHSGSNGQPIGIEVHLMFYQYASNNYLNNTTFVNKKIIYKSTNLLSDFTTTFFVDSDLGNYTDDFMGSDSIRNMMYTYNGDNNDENIGQKIGFGINPPVIGVISLNNELSNIGYFSSTNSYPFNDPTTSNQYYQYMKGNWSNGIAMVQGGLGFIGSPGATSIQSPFMYSGDPNEIAVPSNWSEISNSNTPGDRRMFMSVNSGDLNPGDTINLDFAILEAQGGNNIENIVAIKEIADSVIQFYNSNLSTCDFSASINEIKKEDINIIPNPNKGTFSINSESIFSEINIEIQDMTGRIVYVQNFQNTKSIQINLEEKSGMYFVFLKNNNDVQKTKLIIE